MTTATFDLETTVRLAQRGDPQAFGSLVHRYKNLVFSVALGVLRDTEAAADVTQGVFITAWQRMRDLRSGSSLPPFLRETARRQALHHLRTQLRDRVRAVDAPLPKESTDAEAELAARQEAATLDAALDQIPSDVREVLLLYYSEEQSIGQVATLLELSEDAVKKRLQRARAALRGEYEEVLGRRVRRALPGAAIVAAILASIHGTAQAAPRSTRLSWGVAASAALIVLGGVAMRVQRSPASVTPSTTQSNAGATTAATPPPPSSNGVQSPSSAGAPSQPRRAAMVADAPTKECSIDVNAVQLHAVVQSGFQTREAPALPPGEVAAHLDRALTLWFESLKPLPRHRMQASLSREWYDETAWVMDRCATSELFHWLPGLITLDSNKDDDALLVELWSAAVAKHPTSAQAYGSAASSVMETRLDLAEKWYDAAIALEPTNQAWSSGLARVYARRGKAATPDQKRDAYETALGHYLHAESLASKNRSPEKQIADLEETIRVALAANELGYADALAADLLVAASKASAPEAASGRRAAHAYLGESALRSGHVDTAASELLETATSGVVPYTWARAEHDLAQALLAKGRRDEVVRYLSRNAETSEEAARCLETWKQRITAGQAPDLSRYDDCNASK